MNTITPKFSIVVFLGIPGSGKGTQAKRLAESFGFFHLSTGELFRALAVDPTADPVDKEKALAIKTGKLVADDLVYKLAFAEMRQQFAQGRGVVLDGAIRSVAQAEAYDTFFAQEKKTSEVIAISLALSDEEGLRRLTTRRVCEVCTAIADASLVGDVCPKCGGKLVARADDNPEIAHARLAAQGNAAIEPIAAHYQAQNKLVEIDAKPPIDEVAAAVARVVAS